MIEPEASPAYVMGKANGKLDGLIRAVEIIRANPRAGTRELCRLLVAEADMIIKGQETVNGR